MSEAQYICPECKGSGIYQGLNTVEPCRACGGLQGGILVPPEIANVLCDAAKENRVIRWDVVDVCQQFAIPPDVLTVTYTTEPQKPFDEIMPAEHEELDVGDYVSVEIQCQDTLRPFDVIDTFINRPLFGKPSNSFLLEDAYVTTKRPGAVFGELLYMPTDDRQRVGDPCQDMLFIPIVED